MDTKIFIEKFAEALEIETTDVLSTETIFRELEEWDSLAYLSVIAMMDEEFEIQIENVEFKQLKTLGDIMNYITNNHKDIYKMKTSSK
ncbi:acyl carrier protein [Bacteroides xylanisolvens]|uniref:acyl carrier protein n=1 Tax=Bacteroides xylanisolvens TaxID=371601 RepID=UPI0039B640BB